MPLSQAQTKVRKISGVIHLTQVRRSIHIPALSRPMMQINTVLLLEKIFMIYFPIQ